MIPSHSSTTFYTLHNLHLPHRALTLSIHQLHIQHIPHRTSTPSHHTRYFLPDNIHPPPRPLHIRPPLSLQSSRTTPTITSTATQQFLPTTFTSSHTFNHYNASIKPFKLRLLSLLHSFGGRGDRPDLRQDHRRQQYVDIIYTPRPRDQRRRYIRFSTNYPVL